MKTKSLLTLTRFAVTTGALFWSFGVFALAQAPAGPMTSAPQPAPGSEAKVRVPPPPPPPRQTILGAWRLNRDESDDPRDRMRDSDDSNRGYGGRRGGGTWPGGGGYPGGGRGGGYGRRESDEERQKMRELLSPPTNITLSMTGAEVDLKDDHDRKRAFMTDGRKLQSPRILTTRKSRRSGTATAWSRTKRIHAAER